MPISKILYIDEERVEISGILNLLMRKNIEVTHFCWPDHAEDLEQEGKFTRFPDLSEYDLVFLDIIMGAGDLGMRATNQGYLTGVKLHEVKIHPKWPGLRVVFISALPEGSNKATAMAYAKKMNIKYLEKKVGIEEKVEAYLAELMQSSEAT